MQNPHEGERGWEIAFEPGLQQVCQNVTEANARRLVACWNACEGIDTEDLEAGSVNIIDKLHDDAAKRVLSERDELLAALKELAHTLDSEHLLHDDQRAAFAQARAAIAKAGGAV